MQPHLIIDYIGLYAPIILCLASLILLRNMSMYLWFFVGGFMLNNLVNIILKLVIKEPRPSKDQKAIEIGVVNGARIGFDKFGMPSGHAQNCGYCLSFITMAINEPIVTTIYSVITIISVFQRHIYKNHTAFQLLIGLVIGLGFGYITYNIGHQYVTGDIRLKIDDDAPL
jgi:membrane-associated phospholipid phosphatase